MPRLKVSPLWTSTPQSGEVLCPCDLCVNPENPHQSISVNAKTKQQHLKAQESRQLVSKKRPNTRTLTEISARHDPNSPDDSNSKPLPRETGSSEDVAVRRRRKQTEEISHLPPNAKDFETGLQSHSQSDEAQSLFTLFYLVLGWLTFQCGLSRLRTSIIAKVLKLVIRLAIFLGISVALTSLGFTQSTLEFRALETTISNFLSELPVDLRTVAQHLKIEPTFERTVCCGKCHQRYTWDPKYPSRTPKRCIRRETDRSKPCNESLFHPRRGANKGPKLVPRFLYNTQSFESWLEYFLARPGIEELLRRCHAPRKNDGIYRDIYDAPAWRNFKGPDGKIYTESPNNLVFGLFVDWFNPYKNKIAGKKASSGVILLVCLNLPKSERYKLENIFIAGITPGSEPTVSTVNNVLQPLVAELLELQDGKIFSTYEHKTGMTFRARLWVIICDLPALRKITGFASHSANLFCSFCFLQKKDIHIWDISKWEPRTAHRHIAAALAWRNATTHVDRDRIFRKTGVRYSCFNELPYWDPVTGTVVGVMHNICEGLFANYFRRKWGIGDVAVHKKRDELSADEPVRAFGDQSETLGKAPIQTASQDDDMEFSESSDDEDLGAELAGLRKEQDDHDDVGIEAARQRMDFYRIAGLPVGYQSPDLSTDSDDDSDPNYIPGPSDHESIADLEDDENEPETSDTISDFADDQMPQTFEAEELDFIRKSIVDIDVPTWIERPPSNLGSAAHGKLKADTWYTLFTIFLPMILPILWGSKRSRSELWKNFAALATFGRIACAYSTSEAAANLAEKCYKEYRHGCQKLFPLSPTVPNQHVAGHIPHLLRIYGPLIELSEWFGERIIGILQSSKTNNKFYQLDFTMLRTVCRRARFQAWLHSSSVPEFVRSTFVSFLPDNNAFDHEFANNTSGIEVLSGRQLANFQKNCVRLTNADYDQIFEVVNHDAPPECKQKHFFKESSRLKRPKDFCNILVPSGQYLQQTNYKARTFSRRVKHKGNSGVIFEQNGKEACGEILDIIQHAREASGNKWICETFLRVFVYGELSSKDAKNDPLRQWPGLRAKTLYYGIGTTSIIKINQVKSHHAHWSPPQHNLPIKDRIILIVDLDRGHSD